MIKGLLQALDQLLADFANLPQPLQQDLIGSGGTQFRSGKYQKLAEGGPVKGPRGAAVPIIAHGEEFVLTADEVTRARRGNFDFLHKLGPFVPSPANTPHVIAPRPTLSTGVKSRDGRGDTYIDNSTTVVHNPVPEKLSETLPAMRRRRQIMRGL